MWALASFAAFLAAIIGHAALRRAAPGVGSVTAFLMVGGLVGAGLAALLLRERGLTVESLAGLASYAFACELYIFLFCSISSSISASLLYRLRSGKIEDSLGGKAMVERRLARMVSSGILEPTAAGYRHTARGVRLLRAYRYLRDFFRREAYAR